jgi:cytochrome c peroxidase
MTARRPAGLRDAPVRATALVAAAVLSCSTPSKPSEGATPAAEPNAAITREPLAPLPPPPASNAALVDLGRRLFDDRRLSSDATIACSSCHDLARGGVDGRARSIGVRGQSGMVNAPTVYNAALNFALFWDGRARTLEEQVDGPLTNPLEMDSRWSDVLAKLRQDPQSAAAFSAIFPDGVTAANVSRALAAFERTLVTRGSPFDRWLEGDADALSADEKEGYETFKSVGCVACHQGTNVGGNMLQRFGVLGDYFQDRGHVTEADYGRFNVTHNEADRFVFRVPSLRNVEYTAPYFHDGAAPTLQRAIQIMAEYQLGRSLTERQVTVIEAFLKSLSAPMARGARP